MASLQQLKDRLSGKSVNTTAVSLPKKVLPQKEIKPTSLEETELISPSPTTLEIEEARYLLSLIAKTDFSGKDIQIVYNTALKLQEILQENLNKENNNG